MPHVGLPTCCSSYAANLEQDMMLSLAEEEEENPLSFSTKAPLSRPTLQQFGKCFRQGVEQRDRHLEVQSDCNPNKAGSETHAQSYWGTQGACDRAVPFIVVLRHLQVVLKDGVAPNPKPYTPKLIQSMPCPFCNDHRRRTETTDSRSPVVALEEETEAQQGRKS